jgi:hypothetical protein
MRQVSTSHAGLSHWSPLLSARGYQTLPIPLAGSLSIIEGLYWTWTTNPNHASSVIAVHITSHFMLHFIFYIMIIFVHSRPIISWFLNTGGCEEYPSIPRVPPARHSDHPTRCSPRPTYLLPRSTQPCSQRHGVSRTLFTLLHR